MKKRMILLSGSGDTVVWFRLEFIDEFIHDVIQNYLPGVRIWRLVEVSINE